MDGFKGVFFVLIWCQLTWNQDWVERNLLLKAQSLSKITKTFVVLPLAATLNNVLDEATGFLFFFLIFVPIFRGLRSAPWSPPEGAAAPTLKTTV